MLGSVFRLSNMELLVSSVTSTESITVWETGLQKQEGLEEPTYCGWRQRLAWILVCTDGEGTEQPGVMALCFLAVDDVNSGFEPLSLAFPP